MHVIYTYEEVYNNFAFQWYIFAKPHSLLALMPNESVFEMLPVCLINFKFLQFVTEQNFSKRHFVRSQQKSAKQISSSNDITTFSMQGASYCIQIEASVF